MASIIQIENKWRAQVRRKGHPKLCKTFATREEAEGWALDTEARLTDTAPVVKQSQATESDAMMCVLIDRYLLQVPALSVWKRESLKHLRKGIGHLDASKLTVADVIAYVERRGYGPSTAQVEMSSLSMLLKTARLLWGYDIPDILDDIRDVLRLKGCYKKSKERDRRPEEDELEALGQWFDLNSNLPMRDIMWFSIHSTMRASEVTRIRWEDYDPTAKTIIIRDRKDPRRKIGNHQEVPLLDDAIAIIERQPTRGGEFIFPYNSPTFSTLFPRACKALGIKDLRWHDLRHEGTSRLFEMGYQIHEVPLFTGHKDWHQLKRYTHLRAKTLRRLGSPEPSPTVPLDLSALLPPITDRDPLDMKPVEIAREISILSDRAALLKRIAKELEQVDTDDTDRLILLGAICNERNVERIVAV